MRILLVNTLYSPISVGGAERSVRELATGLAARGNDVWVLTMKPAGSALRDHEDLDGVHVVRWDLPRAWPFGDEWAAVADKDAWHETENTDDWAHAPIRELVERIRPDVVHTHNVLGFGVGIWAAIAPTAEADAVPVVHTLRDFYLVCAEMNLFHEGRRRPAPCPDCAPIAAPRIAAARHLAALVGVSADTLARHPVVEPSTLRIVIPNAPGRPNLTADARIGHRVGVGEGSAIEGGDNTGENADDGIVFGMLGRLVPEKGFDIAVDAFKRLDDGRARLEIAGTGTTEAVGTLRASIAGDPRIRYDGFAASDDFYSRIDVLVVPSQWDEPYGRVAGEGRLAGLIVAASAVGGIPEVLDGYPEAVLVDEADSAATWTAALHRAAEIRQGLPLDRHESTPHALDHTAVEQQHEALYRTLISQP